MGKNRYTAILERLFSSRYKPGKESVAFDRDEIIVAAKALKIAVPKNLGDLVYSFRYRSDLPESIARTAGTGKVWIIRPAGQGKYAFTLVNEVKLEPNSLMAVTKIPDATPGIVAKYALGDEQALLAKVRYNRLVDTFAGVTCYSLQNHLRTSVQGLGQVETDEIYAGVDKKGVQYVFPVQAKGGRDKLSVVQIEQDIAVCQEKFPALVCRPIAAQFATDDTIVLFELEQQDGTIVISCEKHYRLVPHEQVTEDDLRSYGERKAE